MKEYICSVCQSETNHVTEWDGVVQCQKCYSLRHERKIASLEAQVDVLREGLGVVIIRAKFSMENDDERYDKIIELATTALKAHDKLKGE